jgi:hypothetical protein
MKTLIKSIKSKSIAEIKDAFLVVAGIGVILLLVQVLYWCNLIKAYSWQ